MRDRLEHEIDYLEQLYDYYLEKSEQYVFRLNLRVYEEKLHDLRIEINAYKRVLGMLNETKEN